MRNWKPVNAYRWLAIVSLPIALAHALARAVKDGGWRYLLQRCTIYRTALHQGKPCLWVHAASVGEVITVLPLIKERQKSTANAPLLVTTTTPTGARVLLEQRLPGVEHRYLPIDIRMTCERFLNAGNISALWVVETEIWPWLFACCRHRQKSVTIINARLSNRTLNRSGGIPGKVLRQALHGVRILARSEIDAARYLQLGSTPELTMTVGNLKFSQRTDTGTHPPLIDQHHVVAASTHHDEELQLARAWLGQDTVALLVIVPRHPERGPGIQRQLEKIGIPCALRSRQERLLSDQRIYIADTVGELMQWYAHAKAAFVGGSLVDRGGHNVLEPALSGCPTVVGEHTHNFEDIMHTMVQRDAIYVAADARDAVEKLTEAASGEQTFQDRAARAKRIAVENTQVLQRYAEQLI